MRHKLVRTTQLAVTTSAVTLLLSARAGEIGHYGGGVLNIRDYVMPDPGFYTAIYNYYYTTDQLNNSNGDQINSVIIKPGPGPGIKVGIDHPAPSGDAHLQFVGDCLPRIRAL